MFFFDVKLDRGELMAKMKPVFMPRTVPVVLEVSYSAPSGRYSCLLFDSHNRKPYLR